MWKQDLKKKKKATYHTSIVLELGTSAMPEESEKSNTNSHSQVGGEAWIFFCNRYNQTKAVF